MTCGKCHNYSRGLLRCKLGKCNPKTKKASQEVASTMGWNYICFHNKWKREHYNETYQPVAV